MECDPANYMKLKLFETKNIWKISRKKDISIKYIVRNFKQQEMQRNFIGISETLFWGCWEIKAGF
jgi:hypothetical protein